MKLFLLSWLLGWAYLLEGIIRVLTIGLVSPYLVLPIAKLYAKENTTTNNR